MLVGCKILVYFTHNCSNFLLIDNRFPGSRATGAYEVCSCTIRATAKWTLIIKSSEFQFEDSVHTSDQHLIFQRHFMTDPDKPIF